MLQCPKCKKSYDENYAFCEGCGVKLVEGEVRFSPQQKSLVFDRIERSILFRITRSYTWVVLALAVLGFVGAIIYLGSDIRPLIIKDTSVSTTEVKKVIDAKKAGKSQSKEDASAKTIDPELLSKLDKEMYELIVLLPKSEQDKIGVEKLRGFIREHVGRYATVKEKMKVLREAKEIILKFAEPERVEALVTFFNMKAGKEDAQIMGQTEAKIKLATIGGTFFALIMTIAAFSLILVLLAIERNTRKG
jgi:hypothetical protein